MMSSLIYFSFKKSDCFKEDGTKYIDLVQPQRSDK